MRAQSLIALGRDANLTRTTYRAIGHPQICSHVMFFSMFFQEVVPAPVSNTSEEKVKEIMLMQSGYTSITLLHSKLNETSFCGLQRVLSRQEELKERARLLLEQARRDAAMKAGNKSTTNAQSPTNTPPIDVSSHTCTHFS